MRGDSQGRNGKERKRRNERKKKTERRDNRKAETYIFKNTENVKKRVC